MSNKRITWTTPVLVVVGAVGLLLVVLGGVALSRLPGKTAAGTATTVPTSASAVSPAAAAATVGSAAPTPSVASTSSQASATGSTDGSKAVSNSAPKHVSHTQPKAKAPARPKPSGAVLKDHVSSAKAVTFLAVKNFGPPQTYSAVIVPTGWNDKASGKLVARVVSASLAGPIDAATGQQLSPPASGTPDHSKKLAGVTILAATNQPVRGDITHRQSYKVYVVLLPSSPTAGTTPGAVFIVDRLR